MTSNRLFVWSGEDDWRAEMCRMELSGTGMKAEGTQIGVKPVPYHLAYLLDASDGFVTSILEVDVAGLDWSRHLMLRRDGSGAWTAEFESAGEVDLPPPGGDVELVKGALDCDLGLCPATNTMPVVRHGLHAGPGSMDFLMAWVSVPDLGVHPSQQRYEHIRLTGAGSVVRYIGAHRDFVGDLEFDGDGVVTYYPDLARRVGGQAAR